MHVWSNLSNWKLPLHKFIFIFFNIIFEVSFVDLIISIIIFFLFFLQPQKLSRRSNTAKC